MVLKKFFAALKVFFSKKIVKISSIALAVVLLGLGGLWAADTWNKISHNQMDLFQQTPAPIETIAPTETPEDPDDTMLPDETEEATPEPTPTPTLSPYDQLASQADQSIMKDTLNILLVGVDYSEERVNNSKRYVNKNFNADVMLVLAINFKENKVDMISLPRDSYAKIDNLNGIYKLNFSLEAGGGMTDAGYMNVCKSVQGVLGNIPVNYYIAVTMPVVKELTNAVGGVEYDLDIDFSINGRDYKKGMQHMDGQAVLDYCRIRKGDITRSEAGDLHRVDRQKQMLLTVFKKLQNDSQILDVPKILLSMQGKVFTNMDFRQLASIAVFGKNLSSDKVTMRTMPGRNNYGIFRRNYFILDQEKRVEMIKEIYGVDVPAQYKYSWNNARLLWAYMEGQTYVKNIKSIRAKDAALPPEQQKLTDPAVNEQLTSLLSQTDAKLKKYKKMSTATSYVKSSAADDLETTVEALYKLASSTFSKVGYKSTWTVDVTTKGEPNMRE